MMHGMESPGLKPKWLTDRSALYELSCELDALRFDSPVDCLERTKDLLSLPDVAESEEADALLSVHAADCLRHLSRYHEAVDLCLGAVGKLEKFKDSFTFPRALNSLGSVEGSLGNTSDALKHSLLALQLAESGGHATTVAKCLVTLTFLYCMLQQYDSAINCYERVKQEDCDLAMRTVLCINWSEALNNLERYSEAVKIIDEGLELVLNQRDRKFYSVLLNNKACFFASLSKDEEAKELMAVSERYFIEDGYDRYVCLPSRDLGARYLKLGKFEEGIEFLERSVSLSVEPNLEQQLADINEMLADCYLGLGRTEQACRILKSSVSRLKKKFTNQVIESGENRANEQLEWIRKEYDLLQEINAEMRRAKESVEESNRRKTELLANISHEIRTPMNGVIGLAKKLSRTSLDSNQLTTVRNITKCGENLLNIVDEIISLTEIENGNLQVQVYRFNLREFLDEIVILFQPLCAEKNLVFSFDLSSEVSSEVLGDASRIRQVIINFLGNAVKFTDAGSIILRFERIPSDIELQRVRISISDTGSGISNDSQNAILLGESSRYSLNSRKFGGNGLGLTISRNIIAALGGVFGMTSEPNLGSTFWFDIDLPRVAESSYAKSEVPKSEAEIITDKPLSNLRILVAEDNIINWMVIESLLASLGAVVCHASDGEEAVKLEAMSEFDLILMDCHMPKMSGYQASMKIRERESHVGGHKLILALSADVMGANKDLCRDCGMDGFLAKPISTSDLVHQIGNYLNSPRSN